MKLDPFAKLSIILGFGLIVVGLLWQLGWIQSLRLGRLPGDIVIEKENFKFYFPVTTGILISVVLTIISWIVRK